MSKLHFRLTSFSGKWSAWSLRNEESSSLKSLSKSNNGSKLNVTDHILSITVNIMNPNLKYFNKSFGNEAHLITF